MLALISGGCSKLLGISDPVASGDGGHVDHDGRDDIVVPAGIIRQASIGMFAPLAGCPIRSSTLFRDLDGNSKPELLRIVNGMLEVRIQ